MNGQSRSSGEALTVADHAESGAIVMTLGGDKDTYVLQGEDYLEAGCHAVDTVTVNISDSVQISGDVDTSKTGDYLVTYTAENAAGERQSVERTVHVVDSFDETATTIPVLMYHYVYDADNPPSDVNSNYLPDTAFEAQLQYLSENDYYYPSYEELRGFVEGTHSLPAKSVILTFDDGERGFLDYGVPLLNEYEVPATSFVICNDDDVYEKLTDYASPYVSFQSHTYSMHRDGSTEGQGGVIHSLSEDEIYEDVVTAQEILGATEALAYPYGDNNETAWAALDRAGVLCAFTVENRRIEPGDNPYALPRSRIFGDIAQAGFEWLVRPE